MKKQESTEWQKGFIAGEAHGRAHAVLDGMALMCLGLLGLWTILSMGFPQLLGRSCEPTPYAWP